MHDYQSNYQVIAGIDNENQIRVESEIIGLYKKTLYGAILDTGFSGGLVLPLVTAVDIGLEKVGAGNVTLADGSMKTLPMFMCKIKIAGITQDVDTLVLGNEVLIGMNVIDAFNISFNGPKQQVLIDVPAQTAARIDTHENVFTPDIVKTLKKLTGRR